MADIEKVIKKAERIICSTVVSIIINGLKNVRMTVALCSVMKCHRIGFVKIINRKTKSK